MTQIEVIMVRIYLTEGEHHFQQILSLLHDQERVRGVTAFRGIAGFGQSGKIHSSTLLDMSLDLPLVVEFFDRPEKVEHVLEELNSLINPGQIVSWSAVMNSGE